jgi:hypothetical protein
MGATGQQQRTKWTRLISGSALLIMLAPFAHRADREAWLSKTIQLSVAAAEPSSGLLLPPPDREETPPQQLEPKGVSSPGSALCERYADAAGRIVNGWYPSAFDRIGYGGLIGTLSAPLEVPARKIGWRCAPRELSLELDLPKDDPAAHRASVVLKDILSSLPSLGLDPNADEMKIAVTLQSGDSASFEPAIRK